MGSMDFSFVLDPYYLAILFKGLFITLLLALIAVIFW